MVIPLKKNTQKGEQYHRRATTEQMLGELDGLAPEQLVARLVCHQQPVPFEILIYYLRHAELGLDDKYLEPIFTAFYARLQSALRKTISDHQYGSASAVRSEITEHIMEKIAKDRGSQDDAMYYWEVNFNHALASLRRDTLRKQDSDLLANAKPLTHGDECDVSDEVEIAAADFLNPTPSILDNLAFRLCLEGAINGLPDDEGRAVGLFLQGMQIESQDPEVMTISKELGCTERTVRNRIRRAHERLRIVLQSEEIL